MTRTEHTYMFTSSYTISEKIGYIEEEAEEFA